MLVNPHFLGEFSPLWIPGCALWLEADRGVTLVDGKASAWADQSGNGRHASQATPASRPTYTIGILNGYPVVTFDGNVFMDGGLWWITGATPRTSVCIVSNFTKTATYNHIWQGGTASQRQAYGQTNFYNHPTWGCHHWQSHYDSGIPLSANPTILVDYYDGANETLWVNGVKGNTLPFSLNTGTSSFKIGANINSLEKLVGNLVLLCIYEGVVADAAQKRLERHYSRKYNIALAA